MNTSEPTVTPNSGLLNVADIVVAPNAVFARLRIVPTWGWAFLVASLLGIAGYLLGGPANMHAFETYGPAVYANTPQFQSMDAAHRAQAVQNAMTYGRVFVQFAWVFVPIGLLFGSLIQAAIMLIARIITRAQGTFAQFYALSMTTGVVSSLGFLLAGVIAVIRGPAAYATPIAFQQGIPGLAMLAPGAGPKLAALLTVLNVPALWALVLAALGLLAIGNFSRVAAWGTILVSLLLTVLFVVSTAH